MAVCLVMIVKNEENVIERCLRSTLPFVDTWCIVDTGSTDSTKELILRITSEYGKQGALHDRPWSNFGHNRSEAIELAKDSAPWLFMMDADDIFSGSFAFAHLDPMVDGYTLELSRSGVKYRNIVVFNSAKPWVYKFPVHEYPFLHNAIIKDLPGKIDSRAEGDRSRNPNKYSDDAILLEKEFQRGEFEARAAFYAAQSWKDAGNIESAIQWYLIRTSLPGWKEEVYISYLNLIKIEDDMELKLSYAWKALGICPGRKEVPHAILSEYRKKSIWTLQVYAVGLVAKSTPKSTETLFLEPDIYAYKFHDEFSIYAFYTGNLTEAQASVQLALRAAPESEKPRIRKNIEFIG